MRTQRKLLALVMTLCLLIGIMPMAAFAVDDDSTETPSGIGKENAWTVSATEDDSVTAYLTKNDDNSDTYTLHIEGTGAMADYNNAQGQPWNSYAASVTQIEIGTGITHLGGCAFQGFSNLASIEIPDNITTLGKQVFKNCTKLEDITIPDTITALGDSVFQGTAVKEMTLPEGLTTIGGQLFYGCKSLKEVTLPNSLTSLGQSTFYETTALEKVTFGNGLSEISYQTFLKSGIKTVLFPQNLTSIGQSAFKESKIEEIVVPDGVTELGGEAFRGCSELKSITIPDSVTTIGNNAIRECTSLESIIIPDSVTSIGESAFSNSTLLKCVVLGKNLASLSTTFVFSGIEYPIIYAANDVEFNANSQSKIIVARTDGGTFETAPTSNTTLSTPIKIGFKFMGWYEDADYSAPASDELTQTQGTNFQTYYAKWEECTHTDENGNSTLSAATCTEVSTCSICHATEGEPLGHSFTNYVYNNDATYTSDGTKTATCDNGCETTKTITAEGTKLTRPSSSGSSSGSTTYSISVDTAKNGTVTVSPKNASKGTTVTITAKPDKGYEVDEVVVTDKNGKEISVKDKGNNKYTFTMPAGKVDVEVTFVKEYAAPAVSFDDVSKNAWYYDAAIYAAENGLMSGTGNGNFSPDMTTSRAMIWTILARLDGQNVAVTSGNWYDKAQSWAVSRGVSDGTSPDAPITREQLAVMLYGFAKDRGYTTKNGVSLSRYTDASAVSPWAAEALEWAVGNGLISSMGSNILAPTGTATRAQVAVILMNFCENIAK